MTSSRVKIETCMFSMDGEHAGRVFIEAVGHPTDVMLDAHALATSLLEGWRTPWRFTTILGEHNPEGMPSDMKWRLIAELTP